VSWKKPLLFIVVALLSAAPAAAGAPDHPIIERTVSIRNDGGRIAGTLTMPGRVRGSIPGVLLFHGFTGTRDELPVLGTDDTMYTRTARALAEAGIASLRIDFRGSGESTGTFNETTFSGQISDARAALDYLDRLRKVDDRLAVIGLSQGGLVAASIADDPRLDSVVLWSPVANPVDTYKTILGAETVLGGLTAESTHIVLPWGAEIDLDRPFFEDVFAVDPVAEITAYEGPLQVIVGSRDTLVTPQPYYGQVYLNYHDGDEELVVVDGDHVFDVLSGNGPAVMDEVIGESLDWLAATLG